MSGEHSLEREKAGWYGTQTYIFERGREAVGIRPLEKGQGADTRCVFNYFFVLNDIGPAESPSPLCICLLSSRGLAHTHTHHARAEGPGTRTKRGVSGCVCRTGRCNRRCSTQICPRATGVRSHAAELVPPAIFSLECRHQLAQWSTWCSWQDLAVACEATGLSLAPVGCVLVVQLEPGTICPASTSAGFAVGGWTTRALQQWWLPGLPAAPRASGLWPRPSTNPPAPNLPPHLACCQHDHRPPTANER